jgi:hypothetical protein
MSEGNPIWKLTSPGEWTWEYNLKTGNFNERESFNQTYSRMSCTVKAFDEWLCGDEDTGKIFKIDPTYHREANDPLVFEIESGIVANFPARSAAPRADFDFTAAVGIADGESPIQTDPVVQVSWSNDGGYNYGNPVVRALGAQGKPNTQVSVLRTGLVRAKGRRFKLRVSDPVHVGFMGGQMVAMQRAA